MGQLRIQVLTDPTVIAEWPGLVYIQGPTDATVTVEGTRLVYDF